MFNVLKNHLNGGMKGLKYIITLFPFYLFNNKSWVRINVSISYDLIDFPLYI